MTSTQDNVRVRTYGKPSKTDPELGPLKLLPGMWRSKGRGWNMIALPFATATSPRDYRLLLNQYNEELEFKLVGNDIPNRGVQKNNPTVQTDQFLASLDYQQTIEQIAAIDSEDSLLAGDAGLAIHHEPGLWLRVKNELTDGMDIARLATIPHGDSVLALGKSDESAGVSTIPNVNGLPIGVPQDLNSGYLAPYKRFNDNPFMGTVPPNPNFPGFNPVSPQNLLAVANNEPGINVVKTTTLAVDTTNPTGGILNIPFVVKQANAASMKSTFWIQELDEKDTNGAPKLRLQYLQVVLLDFFVPRRDGLPGAIRWPHVSINTLEKDVIESQTYYK